MDRNNEEHVSASGNDLSPYASAVSGNNEGTLYPSLPSTANETNDSFEEAEQTVSFSWDENSKHDRKPKLSTDGDDEYGIQRGHEHSVLEETKKKFSYIFRLDMDTLKKKWPHDDNKAIIENLMQEEEKKFSYTANQANKNGNKIAKLTDSAEPDDYGFKLVTYSQSRLLYHSKYSVEEEVKNELVTSFFYRPNEIFVVVVGSPSGQATQQYADYNFPKSLLCQLTDTSGIIREERKHITGIFQEPVIQHQNPTRDNQLEFLSIKLTKKVKVRELQHLQKLPMFFEQKRKPSIEIEFGFAYMRILKRDTKIDHFPAVLDHFSKIVKQSPKSFLNNQINPTLFVRHIPSQFEIVKRMEKDLVKKIQQALNNTPSSQNRLEFELNVLSLINFQNAGNFRMKYVDPPIKGERRKLLCFNFKNFPPTFNQVLEGLLSFEPIKEIRRGNLKDFKKRIAYVKFEYQKFGDKITQKSMLDLLEGQIPIKESSDFVWKIGDTWNLVTSSYSELLNEVFQKIIMKVTKNDNLQLSERWNESTIKFTEDYTELYKGKVGYFLAPTAKRMWIQNTNPERVKKYKERTKLQQMKAHIHQNDHFMFDLLHVERDETGILHISLVYIFKRFDAGFRNASSKIETSLTLMCASDCNLLKRFWSYQEFNAQLQQFFPSFDAFKRHFTWGGGNGSKIFIVVAVQTDPGQSILRGNNSPGLVQKLEVYRIDKCLSKYSDKFDFRMIEILRDGSTGNFTGSTDVEREE